MPADLAGMPVFGRERSFRGYRGFGVLKTGAAFEAPVPAEPIAVSEPDESAPLPPIGGSEPDDIIHEIAEPVAVAEMDAVAVDHVSATAPEGTDDLPLTNETVLEEPTSTAEDVTAEGAGGVWRR